MKRLAWLLVAACIAAPLTGRAAPPQALAVSAAGDGMYGQLGDGGISSSSTPVGLGFKALDVAAGLDFSLALLPDGSVQGWGINYQNQVGPDSGEQCAYLSVCVRSPRTIQGFSKIRQIAAGDAVSAGLKVDGTVWSLGWNIFGQLGDGTTNGSARPVRASGLTAVTAIAVGDDHTLALRADGTVWSWGWNSEGQLGRETTTTCGPQVQPCGIVPRKVSGLGKAVAIAAGQQFSLALLADGTVWGWGYNGLGQLGTTAGTCPDGQPCVRTPHQIDGIDSVAAIATGIFHVVALKRDGSVWTWGFNYYGQLGTGSTAYSSPTPTRVDGLPAIRSVGSGRTFSFALAVTGETFAWGNNSSGEFGNGTTTSSSIPVGVPGAYAKISGGSDHSLFLSLS